ncbi:BPSL0761 family protein [Metapseudomonas resinovorans]|uniref:BPSL0761 family protein n=1 Tax=Metapseudomonas resinovorans TaxID=53412 RepID=UPI0012DE20A0|nr:BPSL0761 family protein [Pseudomonas resinovorans]
MTMPHERTRAVIQTHEFLKRIERDSAMSEEMRSTATQLLRHYPTRGEVLLQGLVEEALPAKFCLFPFFSSSQSYQPSGWRRLSRKLAIFLLGRHR